jgi:hypothetical protein
MEGRRGRVSERQTGSFKVAYLSICQLSPYLPLSIYVFVSLRVLSVLPPSKAILLAVIDDTEDEEVVTEAEEEEEEAGTKGSERMMPRQGLLNVLAVLAVLLMAVVVLSDLISFPLLLVSLPFSFSFSFSVSFSLSCTTIKCNVMIK